MEKNINFKELFQTLKKRLLLIIIITTILTSISVIISYFFLTPVYQSSTQILVNKPKDEKQLYNSNEVQTNLQLINTYNAIINSPAILDKVIKEENLKMSTGELNKLISVSSEKDSQVVNVTVQGKSPQQAKNIANAIATTFQSKIKSIMNIDNVSILTKAKEGLLIKPNPLLNIVIALVLGLAVGISVTFLIEYLDTTIKKEQDIEDKLGLPVLGAISIVNMKNGPKERSSKIYVNETRGDSIGS